MQSQVHSDQYSIDWFGPVDSVAGEVTLTNSTEIGWRL